MHLSTEDEITSSSNCGPYLLTKVAMISIFKSTFSLFFKYQKNFNIAIFCNCKDREQFPLESYYISTQRITKQNYTRGDIAEAVKVSYTSRRWIHIYASLTPTVRREEGSWLRRTFGGGVSVPRIMHGRFLRCVVSQVVVFAAELMIVATRFISAK